MVIRKRGVENFLENIKDPPIFHIRKKVQKQKKCKNGLSLFLILGLNELSNKAIERHIFHEIRKQLSYTMRLNWINFCLLTKSNWQNAWYL